MSPVSYFALRLGPDGCREGCGDESIAYQNKAAVYGILFKAAADPKHLGARIGLTAVLHTWGSALTHHPHVHLVVPGGGISLDGERWISCRPGFFLPVRVLSRLFRRLFLEKLVAAHEAGRLHFFGEHLHLASSQAFDAYLSPLRKIEWVVYAKRPFAGPEPCSPIFPATPIASPSQSTASSPSTSRASPSSGRTTAPRDATLAKRVPEGAQHEKAALTRQQFHRKSLI